MPTPPAITRCLQTRENAAAQRRVRLRHRHRFGHGAAGEHAGEPEALREITGPSGGYTEVVRSAEDLGPATQRIAEELNKQYTLGYATTRPQDGSWRTLRVRVKNHEYGAFAPWLFATPPKS